MKKRKIFKTLAFSSLAACMFCLPILAGCTPAEMLPEKPTQGQNFDLGLNPDTDPVVFTTQSGLEIKKSNAKYGSTTTTTTNIGVTHIQDLRGFYYFTMGNFSGTIYTGIDGNKDANYVVSNEPVNWLIIGRGEMPVADDTPAGSAIQGDADKQEIALGNSMYESINLSIIPEHSDIPKGCFLVLSEKLLGHVTFNANGSLSGVTNAFTDDTCRGYFVTSTFCGNRYRYYSDQSATTANSLTWNNKTGGTLYNYINSLFSKNYSTGSIEGDNKLGFTKTQADMIVPQQLYTFYSNGEGHPLAETPSTDGGTYYTMFPLAARVANTATKQNFCIEDYLSNGAKSVASLIGSNYSYFWWTRSGVSAMNYHTVRVDTYGNCIDAYESHVNYSNGVRPAMVMKLS